MTEYVLNADYFDQIVEVREDGTAKRYAKRRRGDILDDLTDDDVERLLAAGAIVELRDAEDGPLVTDPTLSWITYREGEGEGGTTEPVPDSPTPAPDAPVDVPPAPKKTAAVAEWQAYAVARGLPEAEAADLTRAELIERFGA